MRPGSDGRWETYLLRRSASSPVLADLWVFPGGTLRPDDLAPEAEGIDPDFSAAAAHGALSRPPGGPPATPRESLGYFVAAARELLEEAGIVLAKRPSPTRSVLLPPPSPEGRTGVSGRVVRLADSEPRSRGAFGGVGGDNAGPGTGGPERLGQARQALEDGRPLVEVLQPLGISMDLGSLTYYGHWITPEAVPQRFDTRFFLAVLPPEQEASPSVFEMADGLWISPQQAIERSRQGTLALHFATWNHLRRLAPYASLAAVVDFAQTKPVATVMPEIRDQDGRVAPYLRTELQGAW